MKARKTAEDYLKTIYILSQTEDVHAWMIAEKLGVSRPTVSVFLKRLVQEGYILIDSGNVITLTEKGTQIAEPVFARYQVLHTLLTRLGVDTDVAFHDACEMEHGLGDESFAALEAWASGKRKLDEGYDSD